MMSKNDEFIPEEGARWQFDENVTEVFSDMLSRSIPGYESMRELVYRIAKNYAKEGTNILDIGCSSGLSSEMLIKEIGPRCNFVLTDVSNPMLDKCRAKYSDAIAQGYVTVKNNDLRKALPVKGCSVILSCLTIQFTPIEYRQFIIENIYNSLESGGAFVFVEKVLGNTNEIDNVLVKEYYDLKKENRYTEEQISKKRKSLEGVLVPLTSEMNETLLKSCGFRKVDVFWRYLNFSAIVAIK